MSAGCPTSERLGNLRRRARSGSTRRRARLRSRSRWVRFASLGVLPFRTGPRASSSSRTAAAAAATARATEFVAGALSGAGLATLLLDLLTPAGGTQPGQRVRHRAARREARRAHRLAAPGAGARGLPVGYFGASTGAAAALWAPPAQGCRVAAWSPAAGGPTWPARSSARCTRRRCSSSADTISVLDLNRDAQRSSPARKS